MENDCVMEKKPLILVVDDEPLNLQLLKAMLMPLGYDVALAENGGECLRKVREFRPDVILLDVMMPGMDGFEVVKVLKEDEETRIVPVVMVTALREVEDRVRALESGADDFLTKPVDKTELRARVRSLLKVKEYNDHMINYQKKLEEEVARRTKELRRAFQKIKLASLDTIHRLSRAAVYKDEGTGAHIQRMAQYAAEIARGLELDEDTVETVLYAAPMHDIGKIGIPDRILLKPGKLDAGDWETMKTHTIIGAKILEGSDAEFIKMGATIALTHHEKWNGGGYPRGLAGTDIPLAGRVTAVADVFDALLSRRPYKEPIPFDEAVEIVGRGKGSHFDPEIVEVFLNITDRLFEVKERFKDKDEQVLFPFGIDWR